MSDPQLPLLDDQARAAELKRKNMKWLMICLAAMTVTAVFPWFYAPLYRMVCATLGIPTTSSKSANVLLDEARAASLPPTKVRFMVTTPSK